MSAELKFKRPGRISIDVSMSTGGKLYVSIMQMTGRGHSARSKHMASMLSVSPADCWLVEINGEWSLDSGDTSFRFEPDEARQLQETFGLQVRHIAARAAS